MFFFCQSFPFFDRDNLIIVVKCYITLKLAEYSLLTFMEFGFGKTLLGSLSTRVFETRTVTGSELFSLLTCPHTTTFTLLNIFSPLETSSIKIQETILFQHEKCPLPVAVGVSKTRVLKLPIECLITNAYAAIVLVTVAIKLQNGLKFSVSSIKSQAHRKSFKNYQKCLPHIVHLFTTYPHQVEDGTPMRRRWGCFSHLIKPGTHLQVKPINIGSLCAGGDSLDISTSRRILLLLLLRDWSKSIRGWVGAVQNVVVRKHMTHP